MRNAVTGQPVSYDDLVFNLFSFNLGDDEADMDRVAAGIKPVGKAVVGFTEYSWWFRAGLSAKSETERMIIESERGELFHQYGYVQTDYGWVKKHELGEITENAEMDE